MGNGDIIHYGGVRIRIVSGNGNLVVTLSDLNSVRQFTPNPIVLSSSSQEPFRLCNLVTQRAKLRIELDAKDEKFVISRLIVYYKPLYTSLPL